MHRFSKPKQILVPKALPNLLEEEYSAKNALTFQMDLLFSQSCDLNIMVNWCLT